MIGKFSKEELDELEKFRERRKFFGQNLSVKNVRNVASDYPIMYERIFHTESLGNDVFGLRNTSYADADNKAVQLYEAYLSQTKLTMEN